MSSMADLENSEKHLLDVLTRVMQRKVANMLYISLFLVKNEIFIRKKNIWREYL